jgi:bifunctional DNase/RNase
MVKITEVKNNTFFGKLILRQNGKILSLDSRPSDATAIAVRTNSPIYVKTELLKEFGKKIC